VLSVRFIDSGYPFGIFKLFMLSTMTQLISKYLGSPTGFCVGLLLKLRWFSPNPPVSCTIGGTNKTYPNDIAEIVLKLTLNTIKQTNKHIYLIYLFCIFQLFPIAGYECLMPLSSTSRSRLKPRVKHSVILYLSNCYHEFGDNSL